MSKQIEKLKEKPIPEFLENFLLADFKEQIQKNDQALRAHYGGFVNDRETLNFIDDREKYISDHGQPGFVSLYKISPKLLIYLNSYYRDSQNIDVNLTFYYQLVGPGTHVPPHSDAGQRSFSFLYVLDPGGPSVKTQWYQIKDEYRQLKLLEIQYIPYSVLDLTDSFVLEKRNWYKLTVENIHSVENLKGYRYLLAANNVG